MALEVEQQISWIILEALLRCLRMRIHEDQALCTETILAEGLLGLQKKTREQLVSCLTIKMGQRERIILINR